MILEIIQSNSLTPKWWGTLMRGANFQEKRAKYSKLKFNMELRDLITCVASTCLEDTTKHALPNCFSPPRARRCQMPIWATRPEVQCHVILWLLDPSWQPDRVVGLWSWSRCRRKTRRSQGLQISYQKYGRCLLRIRGRTIYTEIRVFLEYQSNLASLSIEQIEKDVGKADKLFDKGTRCMSSYNWSISHERVLS